MIGDNEVDWFAENCAAGILDRHARGNHRTWTAQIGVKTGLVVEHADFHDVIGHLSMRARHAHNRGRGESDRKSHGALPILHFLGRLGGRVTGYKAGWSNARHTAMRKR